MSADGQGLDVRAARREVLRGLPQIQKLLETPEVAPLLEAHVRSAVVQALRTVLAEARETILAGRPAPDVHEIAAGAASRLGPGGGARLRRVINATGIVLHTNLGRSPLAQEALAAMAEAAAGYANLEFDLQEGARGARAGGLEPLLREITGAEAALVVNNAAAAVLLALSGLAAGGEVIVSRGEMVEIGGGFRIPDVVAQGGARLVEVGTTNRTHIDDYRRAITERTRTLLKVHRSNFRIVGFTAEAAVGELAELARARGLLVVHDLGSGALIDPTRLGRPAEPRPQDSLLAGADLVAFSGDKLMGGPQAGLLVGRAAAIDPLRRHPLVRALRPDKATLAGLEATLRLYRNPQLAAERIPVLRMLAQTSDEVQARARRLRDRLNGPGRVEIRRSLAEVGAGSLPGEGLESWSVVVEAPGGSTRFAERLRQGSPPVVGRIAESRLWLDLFTVADAEVDALARRICEALEDSGG